MMSTLTLSRSALRGDTTAGHMPPSGMPMRYRRAFDMARSPWEPGQSTEQIHILVRLSTPGYRLVRPITLRRQALEDGSILVGDREFRLYGVGDTLAEAIADYEAMLIDQYTDLTTETHPLGEYLDTQLKELRKTIVEA